MLIGPERYGGPQALFPPCWMELGPAPAQALGEGAPPRAGGGEAPIAQDRELPGGGVGDVPLTTLVFALSAAFEPAAPSAAVGVGGMKNAVVKMEESSSADGSNSRREPTCGE